MKEKNYLYKQIVEDIISDIKSNKLKPGDKIPTELELRNKYNVSRITITRAAQELEKLNLIYRIKGSGSYVKDSNQLSKPKVTNSYIPLILPFGQQFGYDLLSGVESILKKYNYYVSYHNSNYNPAKEREIINQMIEQNVEGLIIYPCSSHHNLDIYSNLIVKKIPFVTVDRTLNGLSPCSVMADNYSGFYTLINYLISIGHKDIAFVSTNMQDSGGTLNRYKGYCQALINSNITIRQELIYDNFLSEGFKYSDSLEYSDIHMESALRTLNYLMSLPNKPTAIAAINDMTAIYLVKAALSMNIEVPNQLSITGFDNLSITEHIEVPLTTVEQSFFEMGQKAGELLESQINKSDISNRECIINTKQIIRNSVKRLS